MIKLKITKKARDYILSKNDAITVEAVPVASCCGYSSEPIVYEYKPPAPKNYEEFIVDGINIFIYKDGLVVAPEGARICVSDNYTLYLEGIRYRDLSDSV